MLREMGVEERASPRRGNAGRRRYAESRMLQLPVTTQASVATATESRMSGRGRQSPPRTARTLNRVVFGLLSVSSTDDWTYHAFGDQFATVDEVQYGAAASG